MHELSIALSIVEMAEQESVRRGGARIEAVHLRLGALAGVVKEALQFSWQAACADTCLAGTQLLIEEIPLKVYCDTCRTQQELASPQALRCPVCGAFTPEVVQGKELEVFALELAE